MSWPFPLLESGVWLRVHRGPVSTALASVSVEMKCSMVLRAYCVFSRALDTQNNSTSSKNALCFFK